MTKKDYPKAVVMRKYLIIAAAIVVLGIAVIIILNISKSTELNNQRVTQNKNDAKPNTATLADTGWYQNQISALANRRSPSTQQKPNIALSQSQRTAGQLPQAANEQAPSKIYQLTQQLDANQSGSSSNNVTGAAGASNADDQNMQGEKKAFIKTAQISDDDYLRASLNNPVSPYEVKAGTIIPGVMITGINSDLPGQITAQVSANVYDTVAGRYILIPQGARLTGLYDSQIAYGQNRVLVAWKRIIFPNGQSIDLQGMPGADLSGYAGFNDQVNNHYGKIFGSVILMSILSAGAQLSQPQQSANNPYAAPTVNQMLAQSLGTNIANTGTMITQKNLNIQPTLVIRPGYQFNINVTKDMVFPAPYNENAN